MEESQEVEGRKERQTESAVAPEPYIPNQQPNRGGTLQCRTDSDPVSNSMIGGGRPCFPWRGPSIHPLSGWSSALADDRKE
jgi:hypothetical protein